MNIVADKFKLAKKKLDRALSLDNEQVRFIEKVFELMKKTFDSGGKVFWCGNGGSASMSSHLSAELVGRFRITSRKPLNSISLSSEVASITAIANDFEFSEIFSRQLKALGNKGDLLIIFSTSGNSKNILNALDTSIQMKINSIAFLGKDGGLCLKKADQKILIRSQDTTTVQESHLFLGHLICDLIDNHYAKKND